MGSELRLLLASCAWEDPSFIDSSRGWRGLATRKTCSQKCLVSLSKTVRDDRRNEVLFEVLRKVVLREKGGAASLKYGYGLASG
jgi:hypothetical protein